MLCWSSSSSSSRSEVRRLRVLVCTAAKREVSRLGVGQFWDWPAAIVRPFFRSHPVPPIVGGAGDRPPLYCRGQRRGFPARRSLVHPSNLLPALATTSEILFPTNGLFPLCICCTYTGFTTRFEVDHVPWDVPSFVRQNRGGCLCTQGLLRRI